MGEVLCFFDWILFKLKEQDLIDAYQAIFSVKSVAANSDLTSSSNPEVES